MDRNKGFNKKPIVHPYVEDFLRRRGLHEGIMTPRSDGTVVLVFEQKYRVKFKTIGYKSIILRAQIAELPTRDEDTEILVDKILRFSQKLFFSQGISCSYDKIVNAFYAQMELYDLRISNEMDQCVDSFMLSLHLIEDMLQGK